METADRFHWGLARGVVLCLLPVVRSPALRLLRLLRRLLALVVRVALTVYVLERLSMTVSFWSLLLVPWDCHASPFVKREAWPGEDAVADLLFRRSLLVKHSAIHPCDG